LKEAVEEWVAPQVKRAPDWVEVNKGHGRIERREVWLVPSQELGVYLEAEYRWPGLRWSGRIRRYRRRLGQEAWESVKEETWIAGGSIGELSASQAGKWLRGHWEMENRVFWVRDVSYSEDRGHARATGPVLSLIRNAAISLLRRLGFRYIPDGWRAMAARPDRGLIFLLYPNERLLLEN